MDHVKILEIMSMVIFGLYKIFFCTPEIIMWHYPKLRDCILFEWRYYQRKYVNEYKLIKCLLADNAYKNTSVYCRRKTDIYMNGRYFNANLEDNLKGHIASCKEEEELYLKTKSK